MTTLEKTLRAICIAGVFALPFVCLIFLPSLFFPYITGKNFAFRIIVEVMAVAWLALAQFRPRRSWLIAALALFVLVMAIADAFGAVPFKSFWSNFERMDGWITIAHVLVYTIVAASVMQTEKLWRYLWWTTLGVSVYLALYGFFQIAGITSLGQGGQAGLSARVDATFGNPIYFAVYMLFHIFIAAMLWAGVWASRRPADRLAPSLLFGAIILLDTSALFFTGTRGTMLGLIGGALLAAVLYAFVRGSWKVRGTVLGIIAAVVLSAGIITLSRESAFVQSVGFLQRLATISFSDPTIKARFLNMGIAWEGVKERPLLGWGQENYAIVFDKYYDPRMHGQEPWFDRVHNSIFDWLVAGGVLGLLAYLSIFVAALWALWRPLFVRAAKDGFTHAERSILTGLLAGYFVHNLTVFDNVTSYILFGTILAFIVYRDSAASEAPAITERRILSKTYLPYAAIAAALAVWALAWWVNSAALAQNRTLLQAIAPHDEGYARNLELFEEAISYGSLGTQEAREQLASFAVGVGQGEFPAELKKNYYETAVSELQAQMAASPLDARFPLFLSNIYRAYGEYDNAETALTLAHTLSLGKQSILFDLAQNAYNKGDRAGALAYLKQAHELDTSVADARVLYAAMAIRLGNDALAAELLAPVIPSGKAAVDPILGAYVSRGQYAPLIPIWRAKIAADPRGTQAYVTLAAIHYQLGQLQEARLVLEEGKRAVPESADQFDRLLAEL